jgi:hypothetical protein
MFDTEDDKSSVDLKIFDTEDSNASDPTLVTPTHGYQGPEHVLSRATRRR